jgi:hypothetical protein
VTSQGVRFIDSKYLIFISFLSDPIHRLIITSTTHPTIYLINASTSSLRHPPKKCKASTCNALENANKTLSARPKSYTYSSEEGNIAHAIRTAITHLPIPSHLDYFPQHQLGPIHLSPPNTHQSKNPLTVPRPSRLEKPFPRPTRHTSNSRHHPTIPHDILPNIDTNTRPSNLAKTLCS